MVGLKELEMCTTKTKWNKWTKFSAQNRGEVNHCSSDLGVNFPFISKLLSASISWNPPHLKIKKRFYKSKDKFFQIKCQSQLSTRAQRRQWLDSSSLQENGSCGVCVPVKPSHLHYTWVSNRDWRKWKLTDKQETTFMSLSYHTGLFPAGRPPNDPSFIRMCVCSRRLDVTSHKLPSSVSTECMSNLMLNYVPIIMWPCSVLVTQVLVTTLHTVSLTLLLYTA